MCHIGNRDIGLVICMCVRGSIVIVRLIFLLVFGHPKMESATNRTSDIFQNIGWCCTVLLQNVSYVALLDKKMFHLKSFRCFIDQGRCFTVLLQNVSHVALDEKCFTWKVSDVSSMKEKCFIASTRRFINEGKMFHRFNWKVSDV